MISTVYHLPAIIILHQLDYTLPLSTFFFGFFLIKFFAKSSHFSKSSHKIFPSYFLVIILILIRLGFLKVAFSWESILPPAPLQISGRTNPVSIWLYTIVKQSIESRLKIKKYWQHLLYAAITSLFTARKCQKIQKINENG